MKSTIESTLTVLEAHMKAHAGQLLTVGSFASVEFDRLYHAWIRARWDAGDRWVRSVWGAGGRP